MTVLRHGMSREHLSRAVIFVLAVATMSALVFGVVLGATIALRSIGV